MGEQVAAVVEVDTGTAVGAEVLHVGQHPIDGHLAVVGRCPVETDTLGSQRMGGVDAEQAFGLLG